MSSWVISGNSSRPMWKGMGSSRRASINRRLQPLRIGAVVFVPTFRTLGDLGQHCAVARQRGAVDQARRVPQLGADDRLGALEVDALDLDDEDGARRLAGEDEAFEQR